MGVLGWAAGQLVVTSLTLGYLKHKNVIQCDPTAMSLRLVSHVAYAASLLELPIELPLLA